MSKVPKKAALVVLVGAALSQWVGCGDGSPQSASLGQTTLDGEIDLRGCAPAPKDVTVKARPISGGTPGVRIATVAATQDPLRLTFHFDGLDKGVLYQLGVSAAACSSVRWRGPQNGLVLAGADNSTKITGYAATTELEVKAERPGGSVWVGADAADFGPVAVKRTFRARTTLTDVSSGELQIAVEPFAPDTSDCSSPAGLVYRQTVPLSSTFTELPAIDLRRVLGILPVRPPGVTPAQQQQQLPPRWPREVLQGAPLYSRVVPISNGKMLCAASDGTSATVLLSNLGSLAKPPTPSAKPLSFSGAYSPATPVLQPPDAQACYRVTRAHQLPADMGLGAFGQDPFGWMVVVAHPDFLGQTFQPGTFFCMPPATDNDGIFSSLGAVGSVISGIVDGIGEMVGALAQIWEEVKGSVVSLVADAINTLGLPCDTTCREGLTVALDTGLVAMGLPPSIPDFDKLSAEGLDYLVAVGADQIGVPPGVADMAIRKVVGDLQQAKPGLGPLADWVTVDDGFRPAVFQFTLSATPSSLIPDQLALVVEGDVFSGILAPLPRGALTAGQTIHIPVVAPLDLNGLPDPPTVELFGQKFPLVGAALWYHQQWFARMLSMAANPCLNTSLWGFQFIGPTPIMRIAEFKLAMFGPQTLSDGHGGCE